MKKTLILLAHPNLADSRLNKTLIESIKDLPEVKIHNLYATYANTPIDVAKEQDLLLSCERIIFQFPLYWYSTPSLLKEWQDKVLEYGFAYGSTGDKLKNKTFQIALTIGAPKDAYQPEGLMQASIDELLKPLQTMALMTQMHYAKPFSVYGALGISDETLAQKGKAYRALLVGDNA